MHVSPRFVSALKFTDKGGYPYLLAAPLRYHSDLFHGAILVPKGFRTDLATIPWCIQPLFGFMKVGRYDRAAVIHDYLYATQWLPRSFCDRILREAMQTDRVPFLTCWAIWAGVRLGGWLAWHADGRYVAHFRRLH